MFFCGVVFTGPIVVMLASFPMAAFKMNVGDDKAIFVLAAASL